MYTNGDQKIILNNKQARINRRIQSEPKFILPNRIKSKFSSFAKTRIA